MNDALMVLYNTHLLGLYDLDDLDLCDKTYILGLYGNSTYMRGLYQHKLP
jgi:hypothetical protein